MACCRPPLLKFLEGCSSGLILFWVLFPATAFGQTTWVPDENLRLNPVVQTGKLHSVLATDKDVWLGSESGLFRWHSGGLKAEPFQLSDAREPQVDALVFWDSDVYVGTGDGLYRLHDVQGKWQQTRVMDGWVTSLTESGEDLWIGTVVGLYRWQRTEREAGSLPKRVLAVRGYYHLSWNGQAKRLWVATQRPQGGLLSWQPGLAEPKPDAEYWKKPIYSAHQSGQNLWISGINLEPLCLINFIDGARRVSQNADGPGRIWSYLDNKENNNALWLAAEKGLFRWAPGQGWEPPQNTGLVQGRVQGISRLGETLWIAASGGLFQIKGLNGSAWTPSVAITETTSGEIFTNTPFKVTWTIKNLSGRTTPDLVHFEVVLKNNASPTSSRKFDAHLVGRTKKDGRDVQLFGIATDPEKHPLPPGTYTYAVHAYDLNGIKGTAELEDEAMAQQDPQQRRTTTSRSFVVTDLRWYTGGRIAAVAIPLCFLILVVFFYVPLRRGAMYLVGYKYSLSPDECSFRFEVREQPPEVFTISDLSEPPHAPSDPKSVIPGIKWPASSGWLEKRRERMRGENALVSVGENGYQYPWAHLIGGDWSRSEESVVAGQVIHGEAPDRPERRIGLSFASLGCVQAKNNSTLLREAGKEALAVEKKFRRTRSKIVARPGSSPLDKATIEDFTFSLKAADIVHVATHASAEMIQFSDGDFCVEEVRDLHPIRCRLLVLSACDAAAFHHLRNSLARVFVSKGLNVLASLAPVEDEFCAIFFPALYSYILPPNRIAGMDLGSAIRMAARDWEKHVSERTASPRVNYVKRGVAFLTVSGNAEKQKKGNHATITRNVVPLNLLNQAIRLMDPVNAFVLFGDPSLQIRLTWKTFEPARRRRIRLSGVAPTHDGTPRKDE